MIGATMNEDVKRALAQDRTIDITTIGRTSGKPRRIENWFHRLDDRVYMTGSPGRRDWYANLVGNADFTFHLKETTAADLPARATPITDAAAKRAILTRIMATIGELDNLNEWVERSPLVEVSFV
ncbi:MAG: nitroreductase family deazaflavin-dependent oxidoreductase [Chloroflexia bacterium]|nr:nitroreductase family deazaflavin-dependent oxidoreductase [Chloroflexia bacterium]MDQ3411490.1 nitroreductase/quinone reductase family protein [Chloroflexota bacterium]